MEFLQAVRGSETAKKNSTTKVLPHIIETSIGMDRQDNSLTFHKCSKGTSLKTGFLFFAFVVLVFCNSYRLLFALLHSALTQDTVLGRKRMLLNLHPALVRPECTARPTLCRSGPKDTLSRSKCVSACLIHPQSKVCSFKHSAALIWRWLSFIRLIAASSQLLLFEFCGMFGTYRAAYCCLCCSRRLIKLPCFPLSQQIQKSLLLVSAKRERTRALLIGAP